MTNQEIIRAAADILAEIEPVSVPDNLSNEVATGSASALAQAEQAFVEQSMIDDGAVPRKQSQVSAFSFTGDYAITVTNPDSGLAYPARLSLDPPDDGTSGAMLARLELSLDGGRSLRTICGTARLTGQSIEYAMLSDKGSHAFFGTLFRAPAHLQIESMLGTILYQQDPFDICLNGDTETTEEAGYTTYSIIKLHRLDEKGRPVFEGTGDNRRAVYDCYFWRGGKWWKIKDPTLFVQGSRELIDLRDGSSNPNYEEASTASSERLNRLIFPTGWQDFWQGFDEATARQLQGLSLTLQATTGVDLDVWMKIRRLRDQGRSWEQIWDECWFDIALAIGFAVLAATQVGKLLKPIFGRFLTRLLARLRRVVQNRREREFLRRYLRWLRDKLRRLQRELDESTDEALEGTLTPSQIRRLRTQLRREIRETQQLIDDFQDAIDSVI